MPLSAEQQQVVQLRSGEAVVAAGPGTGKTHVVAARVVELLKLPANVAKKDFVPRGILALTFTHAAALTLRQRVESLIPIDRSARGAAQRSYEICTMHSFARQAVAEYHLLLGLPHQPTVLSRAEQSLFISRILHRLPLRYYAASTGLQLADSSVGTADAARVLVPAAGNADTRRFVGGLIAFFGQLQERGITAEAYDTFLRQWISNRNPSGELVGKIQEGDQELYERAMELCGCYRQYERLKREQGLIDMGDMILQLHELLKHHSSAALELAGRFDHIVVDEFQDLSPVQLAVVEQLWAARNAISDAESQGGKELPAGVESGTEVLGVGCRTDSTTAAPSGSQPSLLVVGDDEQAIFQWRLGMHDSSHVGDGGGASLRPLESFRASHTRATVFELRHSYRALPALQLAADRVLRRYDHSGPGNLATSLAAPDKHQQGKEPYGRVDRQRFDTAAEEVDWIAQRVHSLVESGQARGLGDIAVLCRHNYEAHRVGQALASAGIATNVVGGSRLFEVPRVAELLHLLAALVQWPGHGCYHLYSLLAAASTARQKSPAANSPESCLADLFGLPLPLLTALSSYNSQSGWPLRRLIEEAAQGSNWSELCENMTAVCGASLSAEEAQSMLLELHNTLAIHEMRVHTMPPSLLLSRLLEESGMAAAYSMATNHSEVISADHDEGETVAAMMHLREAAAVGRFLRYLAGLEQDRSLTGGGATDWAAATFLVPYLHSLREAGEDPAMEMDDDNGIADGGGGGRAQREQGRLGIANSVDVLTIHKAKGLEWAHVFVACATESHLGTPTSAISSGMGRRRRQALGADLPMPSLPSSNPDHSLRKKPDGIGRNEMAASADDEARKLFYVAMTRARESLTFTSARHYGSGNGRGRTSTAGTPEQECLFVSEAVNDAFDAKTDGEGSSFSGRVVIAPADPGIARDLLDASAFLMDSLFPLEDNHHLLLDELRGPDIRFFVAQEVGKSFMDDGDDTAGNASGKDRVNVIGCAALALRDGYGEVKSMFVHKRARGKGVGRSLLERVEEEAHRQALPVLRLETGDLLHDALRLYASAGFVRLAHPFGDYPMNDTSVFMEKHISISRT